MNIPLSAFASENLVSRNGFGSPVPRKPAHLHTQAESGAYLRYLDAAAGLGRNPVSTRFSLSMEMSRLTRDGTAEPVSRDQIIRHARGQGNIHFPCSADHEQDWQSYPVDPYSAICDDHTYTHTYT